MIVVVDGNTDVAGDWREPATRTRTEFARRPDQEQRS